MRVGARCGTATLNQATHTNAATRYSLLVVPLFWIVLGGLGQTLSGLIVGDKKYNHVGDNSAPSPFPLKKVEWGAKGSSRDFTRNGVMLALC